MNLLFLCLLALTSLTFGYDEDSYQNGYSFERSGDIVVDTDEFPVEIQLGWSIMKRYDDVIEKAREVEDVSVYNLISRSLGLPLVKSSLSEEDIWDYGIEFDFFAPKRGNLLFSVEGLSTDILPSSTEVLGKTPTYSLHQTSRPYNPLSTLTTILTGVSPRHHGVVNERKTTSSVPNLFDITKALYPESTIVSGALCKSFSHILSPHKADFGFHWDSEIGLFVSDRSDPPVIVSEGDISSHLSSLGFDGLSYQSGSLVATIGDVIYDLSDETDRSLFIEIAFVTGWTSYLQQTSRPCSFSFHFRSIAKIGSKYGVDSPQWRAAVLLLDYTLHRTITRDFTFEIVFLPASSSVNTKMVNARLSNIPTITHYVSQNLLPHLYLTEKGKKQQLELCNLVKKALSTESLESTVFCPLPGGQREKRAKEVAPLIKLMATTADVLAFHYVFWTMMILLVAFIWATYALYGLESDESLKTASTYFKGPRTG